MVQITEVQLNNRKISNRDPAIVIAGMNVIESEELCISVAGELKNICERNNVDFIFKASYDKANRSSIDSFRGPGIDQGLKILKTVKDEFNVPIISDIHEPSQAETAAEVLDVIQIPAFLSRQTDLIKAACETEKVINVKKAQFLSPAQMMNIIEKCNHFGNENILLCERGSIFGYDNLIVDFLGIDEIKKIAPTILDITHSLQLPGGKGKSADGRSSQAKVLGTAAAAIGLAGFFIEVHPTPENALCDGASATRLSEFESLLLELKKFDELSKSL
ncbi:MAG: 3-deoxy-8-phosphooctulonate synthase [Gammaproteobacteria bacterium]|jgi:2-dehydro-3-deoxyphosphooctonate aldolase (KDO 8-P synthase)|nr:MAG: 3-deoxy-8-phosphooctulonate synthase [Gammaproteobacteria bacterium]|tara:strand:+ start:161 stop:988 length:828 start_codon:yes stop_codon:yes gene_type:complete